jgi:hypothetical protein
MSSVSQSFKSLLTHPVVNTLAGIVKRIAFAAFYSREYSK